MSKEGVLLVNLGSPDSTEVNDVRNYLDEFLMDQYVIDYPYWKRWLLVKGIILNFRPKKSAAAYKKIWWDDGSPLIVISQEVRSKLQNKLSVPVGLGMRYGKPSIEYAIKEMIEQHPDLQNLFVIPLYPQYAESTTRTVIEKTQEVVKENKWKLNVTFQPPFFKEEKYIDALSNSIKPYLQSYDHFLFSYHGLPVRHVQKTDPTNNHCMRVESCCLRDNPQAQAKCYRHQCFETTEFIVNDLEIPENKYSISFQSRLGSDPWIEPFTDEMLVTLAKRGVKRLAVICPAFVSDCLETLEEIGMEGRETFLEAGGEEFVQIPCLNASEEWIDTLTAYCERFLKVIE